MSVNPTFKMPRTSVSFAPTPPFAKAYPDEVKQQTENFSRPSWAEKMYAPPVVEAQSASLPSESKVNTEFVMPVPQNPLLTERDESFVQSAQPPTLVVVGVGVLFLCLAGASIYLIWKATGESSIPTSTLP